MRRRRPTASEDHGREGLSAGGERVFGGGGLPDAAAVAAPCRGQLGAGTFSSGHAAAAGAVPPSAVAGGRLKPGLRTGRPRPNAPARRWNTAAKGAAVGPGPMDVQFDAQGCTDLPLVGRRSARAGGAGFRSAALPCHAAGPDQPGRQRPPAGRAAPARPRHVPHHGGGRAKTRCWATTPAGRRRAT